MIENEYTNRTETQLREAIKDSKGYIESTQRQIETRASRVVEEQARLELMIEALEAKVKARQEAAAAAAKANEEKLAKTKALLTEQIAALSTERLVDLLAEQGVTQIGPKAESAYMILSEALDTLRASYWIKNEEILGSSWFDSPDALPEGTKGILVKSYYRGGFEDDVTDGSVRYKQVTGVCSVGALALTRALKDDAPVESWAALMNSDRSSRIAAEALCWAISQEWESFDPMNNVTATITNWNDWAGQTKEEVLKVWEKALECPFLNLPDDGKLYRLAHSQVGNLQAVYRTEAEAEAAFDRIKNDAPVGAAESKINSDYGRFFRDYESSKKSVEASLPNPRVAMV